MVGTHNNNIDMLSLQHGIICNELFIYSKSDYLYVIKDDIRMFKVSFKRLRKTIYLSPNDIFSIIVKNPNNIYLESKNNNPTKYVLIVKHYNKPYNGIFTYEIKLKEINNYLRINDNEKIDNVIYKQKDKINILLKKLEYYENKYPDILTDEEFL